MELLLLLLDRSGIERVTVSGRNLLLASGKRTITLKLKLPAKTR